MLFSSLVCISGIRQEVICLKSSDECSQTITTQMCKLLLVCLPHCVITFVADVKHRGQCSPGSIAVQTSGSTNYRSYSDPIELWVMLFFYFKSVMKLGLFLHINYTSDHCKIRAWFPRCSMLLILNCKCSGHNNHMVAWRRLCDDLRQTGLLIHYLS